MGNSKFFMRQAEAIKVLLFFCKFGVFSDFYVFYVDWRALNVNQHNIT